MSRCVQIFDLHTKPMILGRVILGNKLLDGALAPASQDPLRGLLFMCRVSSFAMGKDPVKPTFFAAFPLTPSPFPLLPSPIAKLDTRHINRGPRKGSCEAYDSKRPNFICAMCPTQLNYASNGGLKSENKRRP